VRSVGVYRQYADYARDFGVRLVVVGNKVTDAEDVEFLQEQIGGALLGWMSASRHVRAAERGATRPIDELEPRNLETLRSMLATVDAEQRDWARYQRQAVEFHLRNAKAWAGADLVAQVDPEFVLGPQVVV
jgi:CO dehydrogenase maturation factor